MPDPPDRLGEPSGPGTQGEATNPLPAPIDRAAPTPASTPAAEVDEDDLDADVSSIQNLPRLTWERVGGGGGGGDEAEDGASGAPSLPSPTPPPSPSLPFLAPGDTLTAAASTPRATVLGTAAGRLHILDAGGHEVRRSRPHGGGVSGVSLDAAAEAVASVDGGGGGGSARTGMLVVSSLADGGEWSLALPAPGTAVAVDPKGGSGKAGAPGGGGLLAAAAATASASASAPGPAIAIGLADGRVMLVVRKGWLGRPGLSPLLEAGGGAPGCGEGGVAALAWSGEEGGVEGEAPTSSSPPSSPAPPRLLAWATAAAAYVADPAARRLIARLPRPGGAGAGARLAWGHGRGGRRELWLAWGQAVRAFTFAPLPPLQRHPVPGGAPGGGLASSLAAAVSVATGGVVGGAPPASPATAARAAAATAAAPAARLAFSADLVGSGDTAVGAAPLGRDAALVLVVTGQGGVEARALPRESGRAAGSTTTALPFPRPPTPGAVFLAPSLPPDPPPPPPRPALDRDGGGGRTPSPAPSSVAGGGGSVWEWGGGSAAALPVLPPRRPPRVPRPSFSGDDDPSFLVCGPTAALMARPLAGDALVTHLIGVGRPGAAVAAARAAGSGGAVRAAAAGAWLDKSLSSGNAEGAAAAAPRLLGPADAREWERAVHAFAGAGTLPSLAPYVPTAVPAGAVKKEKKGWPGRGGASSSSTTTPAGLLPSPLLLRLPTYTMVLHSLLLHPRDHPTLLALVRGWPPAAVDAAALAPAAAARARAPGGATPALVSAAADLHTAAGDPGSALRVMLAARHPDCAAFAASHGLFSAVVGEEGSAGGGSGGSGSGIASLLAADKPAGLAFLATHWRACPPPRVVRALDEAAAGAASAGDVEAAADARRTLHSYLSSLFWAQHAQHEGGGGGGTTGASSDPPSPASDQGLATRLVELTADYGAPGALAALLAACQSFDLAAAAALCAARGLVRERVLVLGRMGADEEAVTALVSDLGDIRGAAAFIADRDAAAGAAAAAAASARGGRAPPPPPPSLHLWRRLVELAVASAPADGGAAVGALLDAAAGGCAEDGDAAAAPLAAVPVAALVAALPPTLPIPRLAPRLAAAARDARARAGLAAAAAAVVAREGAGLGHRLYGAARAAVREVVVVSGGAEDGEVGSRVVGKGGGGGGAVPPPSTPPPGVWLGWVPVDAAAVPAGRRARRGPAGPAPLIGVRE